MIEDREQKLYNGYSSCSEGTGKTDDEKLKDAINEYYDEAIKYYNDEDVNWFGPYVKDVENKWKLIDSIAGDLELTEYDLKLLKADAVFNSECTVANLSLQWAERHDPFDALEGLLLIKIASPGFRLSSNKTALETRTSISNEFISNSKTNVTSIHKNSNSYVGPQAVYEIRIDGKLYKYGKADMTNMSSTGLPTRLQSQLNKLKKQNLNSKVTGKLVYENKNISTADVKKVETKYIQSYYDKYSVELKGNKNHKGLVK